jgi:hypothetical protein
MEEAFCLLLICNEEFMSVALEAVKQVVDSKPETLNRPVVQLTDSLRSELEVATIEVADEIYGREFAQSLRPETPEQSIWNIDTLLKIQGSDEATPFIDRVFDRAAEIQHGRKPQRKVVGKNMLGRLKLARHHTIEIQSDASTDSQSEFLARLSEWPRSQETLSSLFEHEEAEAMVYDTAYNEVALSLRRTGENHSESDDSVLDAVKGKLNEAIRMRVTSELQPRRQETVATIFDELAAKAVPVPEAPVLLLSLPVDDETVAPVAALLAAVGLTRDRMGGRAETSAIHFNHASQGLTDLVHSSRGLVFSESNGIGRMDDLRLYLRPEDKTDDGNPLLTLNMDLVATTDDEPTELVVTPKTIWNTSAGGDLITAAVWLGKNGIRPIEDESLADALEAADHYSVLQESLATIEVLYADNLAAMPKLSDGWEARLKKQFEEEVFLPDIHKIYRLVDRLLDDRERRQFNQPTKTPRPSSLNVTMYEKPTDTTKKQVVDAVDLIQPEDPRLMRAALTLRGLDPLSMTFRTGIMISQTTNDILNREQRGLYALGVLHYAVNCLGAIPLVEDHT